MISSSYSRSYDFLRFLWRVLWRVNFFALNLLDFDWDEFDDSYDSIGSYSSSCLAKTEGGLSLESFLMGF